ncbi:helix-turn-helix domain-containing protein [Myceligenerans halotolerans]
MSSDEFEHVRAEEDPIRQARRATELLQTYSQRSHELARLRKAAIDRAHDQLGMTYTEVASKVGISKGRITQLRKGAPPAERAFFGVGPVTVAFPIRKNGDRALGVVAIEDDTATKNMSGILESLSLAVDTYPIPPSGDWEPPADAVAICGPKSSHITAQAVRNDPFLSFEPDEVGRWVITDRKTGDVFVSPSDAGDPTREIAYVARLRRNRRIILIIAGVHALGSVGAVEYLRRNLPDLYVAVGDGPFSLVVTSAFDGMTVTETSALWGPKAHP